MLSSAIPVLDGTFSDPSLQNNDYIIRRNFTCRGNERNLLDYIDQNRSSNYCDDPNSRMKPAGVYCFGQTNGQSKSLVYIRTFRIYAMQKKIDVMIMKLDLAIVPMQVVVRLPVGGLWGTVCDDGWTRNDANAVCRQQGYNHGM